MSFTDPASRGMTRQTLKRKTMGAPQSIRTVQQTKRNPSVFDAGYRKNMGTEPRPPPIPKQSVIRMKTGAVNTSAPLAFDFPNVAGGATNRSRVPFGGGNSPAQLAMMRRMGIGQGTKAPPFGTFAPDISQWTRTPAEGLLVNSGMPKKQDDFYRNMGPLKASVSGMGFGPAPPKPTVWNQFRSGNTNEASGLVGSESNELFIQLGSGANQYKAISSPFTRMDFGAAAAKVQNNSTDGNINALVKYTYTLNETASAYATEEQAWCMWFMHIENNIVARPKGTSIFPAGLVPLHNGYSLVTLNYMLALAQLQGMQFTPREVLDEYKFVGIAVSETGATKTRYLDTQTKIKNRNVVVAAQGPTDAYNTWRPLLHYLQHVGLILKGVPITQIFASDYTTPGSYNLQAGSPGTMRVLDISKQSLNPLQFVPWSDPDGVAEYPTPAELNYINDAGEQCTGIYIKVGHLTQIHKGGDAAIIARTPYSQSACLRSGKIRLHITSHGDYC